jgi:4-hydroxythreonine-4-phosphate dehydrogenase
MPGSNIPRAADPWPSISRIPYDLAPIALSMGDPAGIGPDIALKSWARRVEGGLPAFCFLGDPSVLADRARLLRINAPIAPVSAFAEARETFRHALPVLPVALPSPARPGHPDGANCSAILSAIELGARLVLAGEAAALVTNPISKAVLASEGFPHPGHTEFLGAIARAHGLSARPVMMLASPALRVVPVTIHEPLARVPGLLTKELIVETAEITARGLADYLGLHNPCLAVTGLNPHAGENGVLGREEIEIISPAIEILRARGLTVTGPHAADALFHERARGGYDAVIAMYHDQALIPLKTLCFDEGVNVTLGLPFVRTSPDHGSAFDIAGSGLARAESLMCALRLARTMALAQVGRPRGGA